MVIDTTELVIDIHAAAGDLIETLSESKKAWTLAELAVVLNCSTAKLYRMVEAGRIPYFRLGSMIRFDPKVTAEWLESKSVAL